MSTISLPSTTFNILPAQQDIGNHPHRVLFIGQKLAAGTATDGAITPDVGNDNEWNALFGQASHLGLMLKHFRRYNAITPVDVIAYNEAGAGVAGTGTFPFTGTATASGSLIVVVGSEFLSKYTIAVAVGDTATVVGAAIAALINADANCPFTAASVTGTVTITSNAKGTISNGTCLEVRNVPAGLACVVTAISNGATNPTITGLEALMADRRWQGIVFPGSWDIAALDTILDARFNVTNDILDGVAFVTIVDTYASLATAVSTRNQPLLVAFGEPKVARSGMKGAAHRELGDNISAKFAAIRAIRLTDGANAAPYVLGTNAGKDQTGGMHMASLPYFNTPISDLPLITLGDGFTRTQIGALKAAGVGVIGNNIANNTTIVGEVTTTYMTDVAGNVNTSFKFLEYVDTISAIREYYFNNCRAKYAQCRLTDGALIPGYTMANADSIKAFLCGLYLDLAEVALSRAGEENLKFYKANLSVEIDLANGRVDIDMQMPIVVQLREMIGNIRVTFNTDGSL